MTGDAADAHWNGRRKVPVILFLHGSDERGDDNQGETKNGIRLLIAQDQDPFPAVVVCPQCRASVRWTDPSMEAMALRALDQSIQEFNGDPDRISLTGPPMGGYGTWDLARKYPQCWAAIAPCCAGVGQNSWDYAYKEPGLLPWFLSHKHS